MRATYARIMKRIGVLRRRTPICARERGELLLLARRARRR